MKTKDLTWRPVGSAALPCATRLGRTLRLWFVLAAAGLGLTGCQTFNYTDEDLARERRKLEEGWASGNWRSWGSTLGGMKISPNIGNIGCPGIGGGVVCPGK